MTNAQNPLVPLEAGSLPTSLQPLLHFETSSITGSDGQFDGASVSRCTIARGAQASDIRAGLQAVGEQCRPCGPDFALQQLALLKARTKSRADDNGALTAAAYADWLAEYPKDVARGACEEWARGMVFWPAWADIQKICDRLMSKRLALRKALQKALEPAPAALYLGKPLPETRQQRLRTSIDAFLRHGYPARAARVEIDLAKEESREPEGWARETLGTPPPTKAERPPFKPETSPTALRCAELAKAAREGKPAQEFRDIPE